MAAAQSGARVVIGRIASAHGVRGWLNVQSFADPPEGLLNYPLWRVRRADGTEQLLRVREAGGDPQSLRVSFEGITDRTTAEQLRGCLIEIERSELPPTGEREYYREDLLGFQVRNAAGSELGKVSHFVDGPVNALMVVSGVRELWIPATDQYLRRVRLTEQLVEVDWPEDI
jgi:16S rRNA processing protein RimM